MPTIGQGLTVFGAGIGNALASRRERKTWERLAELLAGAVKPGATGKAVSELAPLLAGVGQAMPIPEHMGGNALPFSTPQFTPQQQAQLRTPAGAAEQNAATAPMRAMLTSGIPQAREMALKQMMGGTGKTEDWARLSDTVIFNRVDGSTRTIGSNEDVKLRENEILFRPNPQTGVLEEIARGAAKEKKPEKTDYVAAETSPGNYTLVPKDFAAAQGLTVKKDSQGVTVGYDAEGRPTVQIGGVPSVASVAGKPTKTAIETEAFNAEKGLLRIENILGSYNDSYLRAPKQWQNWFRDKMERVGFGLSEGGQKELAGYATFESYTLDNLNRYIKEITGAQMSEAEAERLMKAMPTMAEGPTRFSAKIAAIQKALRASHDAYYNALKAGGDQQAARQAGDAASQQSFAHYATGEGFHAGPAPENMPAPPSGYRWEKRPDGVYQLVRTG